MRSPLRFLAALAALAVMAVFLALAAPLSAEEKVSPAAASKPEPVKAAETKDPETKDAETKMAESKTGDSKKAEVAPQTPDHGFLAPDKLVWKDAGPPLPPGAKLAVLEGNPSQPGPFTMRAKMPDGYKIMPHWHPGVEHVTVLSGTLHLGMGDKFDSSKGTMLQAGGFAFMPPQMHHYAWTTGETVIQAHGIGPWKLIYLNPADEPKAAAAND